MTGATAGSAARLAGIDASGTAPKWSASSGVVATLATAGQPRRPATGPRGAIRPGDDDPRHRHERELPAGVARHPRVRRQGDGRREQQRVRRRGGTRRRHRDQPGDAHHRRALQRWTGAGQRHVQRDQGEQDDHARGRRDASEGQQRAARARKAASRSARSPPADARARVAPVIARERIDRLVLAQHHAAHERSACPAEGSARSHPQPAAGRYPRHPRSRRAVAPWTRCPTRAARARYPACGGVPASRTPIPRLAAAASPSPRTRTSDPGSPGPGHAPSVVASSFAPRAGPDSSRTTALVRAPATRGRSTRIARSSIAENGSIRSPGASIARRRSSPAGGAREHEQRADDGRSSPSREP